MLKATCIAALTALGLFALPSEANADGLRVRLGFGDVHIGGHRGGVGVSFGKRHHRHHHRVRGRYHRSHRVRHHVHVRAPIYHKVWIEPVYRRVLVGYDYNHCPVYRNVCVRAGYYRTEVIGYRCNSCNARLH